MASNNGSLVNPTRSASASAIFSALSIVAQMLSGTSSSGSLAMFASLTE